MLVLGIDPGMAIMGYGLVREEGDNLQAVDYGVLTTPAGAPVSERLSILYHGLLELINRYQPEEMAIELFVARNLRSALLVGQARGVAILTAATHGLPVYEYSPMQVKQSVAGYGKGSKEQMQQMVKLQLCLERIPRPDDAADALGLAICHFSRRHLANMLQPD
ncbi:MAG: crossover junction endodeoxyribonuclease RuvC [Dehalococcoidia bacterium]|nr:crossover junction endodeoxyribonuclease RuvC [Dehalococcoidia bacterium]